MTAYYTELLNVHVHSGVSGVPLKVVGNDEDGVIGYVRPSAGRAHREIPGRCFA